MDNFERFTKKDINLKNLNSRAILYVAKKLCNYNDRTIEPELYLQFWEPRNSQYVERTVEEDEARSIKALFIEVVKHEPFLNDLIDNFNAYDIRSRCLDKPLCLVLFYICIFLLCDETYNDVINILKDFNRARLICFFEYLFRPEVIKTIIRLAHLYFNREYILDFVIYGASSNSNMFKKLLRGFKLNTIKQLITTPFESLHKSSFIATSVAQKEVYKRPVCYEYDYKKLLGREEAQTFYENAIKYYSCVSPAYRNVCHDSNPGVLKKPTLPRITKPPIPSRDVKINTSTVLRDAAIIYKAEQMRNEKLLDLLSGAGNYVAYEKFENELRERKETDMLQNIERKHILGLISFEEARLSKKRILKENQEKRQSFEIEKNNLIEKLVAFKKEELQKLKIIGEKAHQIHKNMKIKQGELLASNHRAAQEFLADKKQKILASVEKKKMKLEKKIELIREMRALNAFRKLQPKTHNIKQINYGLLCEMSLDELIARLAVMKLDLKNELQEKKKAIAAIQDDRKWKIQETKTFIADYRDEARERQSRMKQHEKPTINVGYDRQLLALKEKLVKVRKENKKL